MKTPMFYTSIYEGILRMLRVLTIETATGRVLYDRQPLPVSLHWAYLYGLLALRVLDGGAREVTIKDVCRLPTWTEVQPRSVATSVARHLSTMQSKGFTLIAAPHGGRTRRIGLDPEQVPRVRIDVGRAAFLTWLGVSSEAQAPLENIEAGRLLVLAQTAFEQGMYAEAETRALKALALEPGVDQCLRVLALVAWVRIVNSPYDEGWAAVQALQRQLKLFQAHVESVQPSPAAEALVWLQTGRFHMRKQQARRAREAYGRAAKLLTPEHHREWGAVESGLGYLAQQSGHLDEAERRYRAALEQFSRGHWPWAMHVQYNNLAAVCFNLHVKLEETNPDTAAEWLNAAVRWSHDAMEFAREMDYGGAVDLETNLAYAARLQGDYTAAGEWLRRARSVVSASESTTDLACIEAEQAELHEALGDRAAAISALHRAVILLHQVGTDAWTTAAENRLAQLEGRLPLGKPFKLW